MKFPKRVSELGNLGQKSKNSDGRLIEFDKLGQLTPKDVTWFFRLFVRREPESNQVVSHFCTMPFLNGFIEIATSEEAGSIRNTILSGQSRPWLSAAQKPAQEELVEWVTERGIGAAEGSSEEFGLSWNSMILKLSKSALESGQIPDSKVADLRAWHNLSSLALESCGAFGSGYTLTAPSDFSEALTIWSQFGWNDEVFRTKLRESFQMECSSVLFSDLFYNPYVFIERKFGRYMSNPSFLELLGSTGDHKSKLGAFAWEPYVAIKGCLEGIIPCVHYLTYGQNENIEPEYNFSRDDVLAPSPCEILAYQSRNDLVFSTQAQPCHDIEHWLCEQQCRFIAASNGNFSWIGDKPMPRLKRFYASSSFPNGDLAPTFRAASNFILKTYYANTFAPPSFLVDPTALDIRNEVSKSTSIIVEEYSPKNGLFGGGGSLITPFWGHFKYFKECAASVGLALQAWVIRNDSEIRFEWIIANDDPRISNESLLQLMPEFLRRFARIISTDGNQGTTIASNIAIQAAKYNWILFLDCDDLLVSDSFLAMNHYSSTIEASYFSSAMVDINARGEIMRFRPHTAPASSSPTVGMNAGHFKMIKKTLFQAYGLLDPDFNSCQDFEFLLRILDRETVVLVPDFLYMYRWHDGTQSVGRYFYQEQIAAAAKKAFIHKQATFPAPGSEFRKIGIVIRTQGERNSTLIEAIRSCISFEPTVTLWPIIVVHGDESRLEHVQKALNREGVSDKMVSVVHAANLDLRRGYAFNVGAEYAIDVLGCQGVGLVDDDDILLPAFAQMARLLPGNHSAIISGRSLAKSEDGELTEMHKPLFAACLSNENYIPTNAFVVNEVAISLVKRKYGSLFSEEMHYLEDWWFFIAALDAGVQFSVFDEVVGEFRMGSDGNSDIRKYPFEFERCRSKTEQFASTVRRRHGLSLNLRQGNIAQKFAKQLSEVQRTKLLSALKIGKKS